jgi:hypothetical protein
MRGSRSGKHAIVIEDGQQAGQALLIHYWLHTVGRIVLVKLWEGAPAARRHRGEKGREAENCLRSRDSGELSWRCVEGESLSASFPSHTIYVICGKVV